MILLADTGEGPDQTVDAQADLGRHCLHMSEDMISHGMSHIIVLVILKYKGLF